jgi:hypothetical protein
MTSLSPLPPSQGISQLSVWGCIWLTMALQQPLEYLKILLASIGVLAFVSVQAQHSAQPTPLTPPPHLSAKSPSNISPHYLSSHMQSFGTQRVRVLPLGMSHSESSIRRSNPMTLLPTNINGIIAKHCFRICAREILRLAPRRCEKCPFTSMGGRAEGLMWADLEARTPIGVKHGQEARPLMFWL